MQKCGSIVQRSKNGIELLADYHRRSPTHPGATPSRCQPCHHPLSCEGALVLCERAENMKQQFPGDCRRIHAFGERTEGHLLVLQLIYDGQ